jgi:hypothetical protein
MDPERKAITLKWLKAQITNLHHQERQKIATNMEESEVMGGGHIPLSRHPCPEKTDPTNNDTGKGH